MKRNGKTAYFLIKSIVFLFIIQVAVSSLDAQVHLPRYRIRFTDKQTSIFTVNRPEEFLSGKAIQRRNMEGIPVTEEDLPIPSNYLNQVEKTGAKVICTSKWFKTAIVEVKDSSFIPDIRDLPFVSQVKQVYFPTFEKKFHNKFSLEDEEYDTDSVFKPTYGAAFNQIAMHNGHWLHKKGYRGNDILIAVIDAGFYDVDTIPLFEKLWLEQRLVGARNIVNPGSSIFRQHTHGMKVLSIIAGNIPGVYIGTAPDASFWLIRSEDVFSEFIVEEDFWVAAAELADSAGVDVINTSLGYSLFDNPEQNHTYADMDGTSTIISKAATIAASKGITLALSAGNSGNAPWGYITAPADAKNVLSVGAINAEKELAIFSSRGPSYDGRVKPEVVATGRHTFIQSALGPDIIQGNGTSYAAPIIAGIAACLHQAFPEKKNVEIIDAMIKSSNRYLHPDTAFGYGIPDAELAYHILEHANNELKPLKVLTYPNPLTDELGIQLLFASESVKNIYIYLFDTQGKKVFAKEFQANSAFMNWNIPLPQQMASGIYFLKVVTGSQSETRKILKISNGS